MTTLLIHSSAEAQTRAAATATGCGRSATTFNRDHLAAWCFECSRMLAANEDAYRAYRGDVLCAGCWSRYWWRECRMVSTCDVCARRILSEQARTLATCSPDCERERARELRRQASARRRQAQTCVECGHTFNPTRSDARYCGATCRKRAHRAGAR